jgi:hypothetical protein
MKYVIKRPNGDTLTVTLDNLAARVENGVVRADWPAKPEDATEWSTVGVLLAAQPSSPVGDVAGAAMPAAQASVPAPEGFAPSASRRYRDAYLVARATTAIGGVVKMVAIALGVLIVLPALGLGSAGGKGAEAFFAGLVFGAVAAVPIYILGVLVSAQGEVLKATLDTAVHGSPFLLKEDMARVMSL